MADLLDLPATFEDTCNNTPLSQQSLDALHQIYGYLTFNDNKFGILTNWKRALFLCRAETVDRKTLQYYLLELDGSSPSISMLKAWVGMVLLAERNWFYASPSISAPPPSRHFGSTTAAKKDQKKAAKVAAQYCSPPVNGKYQCLPLDFRLCHFDLSSVRRSANGCVVKSRLLKTSVTHELPVICKVVDASRYPYEVDRLEQEACAYASLKDLQGQVIPKLYGVYLVWGILRMLALEPVGDAIPDDEQINEPLRMQMKSALQCIHDTGFIHGDIARRNFCRTADGKVFLVDLEKCCRFKNQTDADNEMRKVDQM